MKLRPPPKPPEHRAIDAVLADIKMMRNPLCLFDDTEFQSVREEAVAILGAIHIPKDMDLFEVLHLLQNALEAKLPPFQAQQTEAPEIMQTRSNPSHATETTALSDEALIRQYEALTDFRAKSLFLDKHGERLRELIREEQAAHRAQHNPNQGTP